MPTCPVCKAELQASATQGPDEKLTVQLKEKDTLENLLYRHLLQFWRCRGEGDRSYRDEQYYYDPYHGHIEYDKGTNTYVFSIQTYDSPEGDTWLHGEFRLGPTCVGPVIEIINKRTSSSAFDQERRSNVRP